MHHKVIYYGTWCEGVIFGMLVSVSIIIDLRFLQKQNNKIKIIATIL